MPGNEKAVFDHACVRTGEYLFSTCRVLQPQVTEWVAEACLRCLLRVHCSLPHPRSFTSSATVLFAIIALRSGGMQSPAIAFPCVRAPVTVQGEFCST